MNQLPLNALRVFESVARCGSFKAAAEELCVSQSAVSHQIKHLETWLSTPLFDRSGNRPALLPQAHVLSDTLNRSFSTIGSACDNLRGRDSAHNLVIAAVPSIAVCWLIPRLADFKSKHPEIATHIVYNLEGREIDFSKVDLAFTFLNKAPDGNSYKAELFQTGISVPVCSPTLQNAISEDNLLQFLVEAGLLHDSNEDGWTDWFQRAGFKAKPPVSGPVFEDFNLLRAAALAGQGVALCPLALIGNDLEAGRLIKLSSVAINENYNYYLIGRKSDKANSGSASEQFSSWVFDTLECDY